MFESAGGSGQRYVGGGGSLLDDGAEADRLPGAALDLEGRRHTDPAPWLSRTAASGPRRRRRRRRWNTASQRAAQADSSRRHHQRRAGQRKTAADHSRHLAHTGWIFRLKIGHGRWNCTVEAILQFLSCGKIFSHLYNNWDRKSSIWNGFRGKNDNLSTNNLLCRNFAAICRKIATSSPTPTFLTHGAAGR